MTKRQEAQYLKAITGPDGQPLLVADDNGGLVSRAEFDEVYQLMLKYREDALNNEGMAECMSMFRRDMINAGVVTEQCPPMMMTEGVCSYIANLAKQVTRARLGPKPGK